MSFSSFDVRIDGPHERTIERVTEALKTEGFGVLTRIDVHQAFAEKLGTEFRPYTILGACNPQLAHAALTESPEVGLMLPCNVTVEEEEPGKGRLVRIVDPKSMMQAAGLEGNPMLAKMGQEAYERLQRVARTLSGA